MEGNFEARSDCCYYDRFGITSLSYPLGIFDREVYVPAEIIRGDHVQLMRGWEESWGIDKIARGSDWIGRVFLMTKEVGSSVAFLINKKIEIIKDEDVEKYDVLIQRCFARLWEERRVKIDVYNREIEKIEAAIKNLVRQGKYQDALAVGQASGLVGYAEQQIRNAVL